jgi:hypothetical protein
LEEIRPKIVHNCVDPETCGDLAHAGVIHMAASCHRVGRPLTSVGLADSMPSHALEHRTWEPYQYIYVHILKQRRRGSCPYLLYLGHLNISALKRGKSATDNDKANEKAIGACPIEVGTYRG